MLRMFSKADIKPLLIITFIVFELIAMLFNAFFVKVNIGGRYFMFSYSMIFFCMNFFIVDLMSNFISSSAAEKMFFYKVFSQTLFLLIGYSALSLYGLHQSVFALMLEGALKACVSSIIAMYCAFKLMNKIMRTMVVAVYRHHSMIWRYLTSTLPFEIIFSFIFCICSFSSQYPLQVVLEIFVLSIVLKTFFSMLFSFVMSLLYKIREYNALQQARQS